MSALQNLLDHYRKTALTVREQGTYFEELVICYFKNEPAYRDLYAEVLPYAEWADKSGLDKRDAGIDLVATTHDGEAHAIQCKLYAADYKVQKSDIDSFFTASGKKTFARRIIVATTDLWSVHAEDALINQNPPVTKLDLFALEESAIDWSKFAPRVAPALKPKKSLRPHQKSALASVKTGLATHDRGKLIMACGTGKTFTSLKIAEDLAGPGKRVLFLVPSLALLSQTLTEWTQESDTPLHSFAVCSDSDVGKKRKKDDDTVATFAHELRYPATTDAARLAAEMSKRHDDTHMSVVFATYHSIDVISQAQRKHALAAFDLIVCDEAHRTTGAKFEGEDESQFTRIHDDRYVTGEKRLYMTATPRIFGDHAKAIADKQNVALSSMDDEALYGPQLFLITFSEAVKRGLLVDYKVLVLAVDEAHISARVQQAFKDNNELRMDDAAKIIGCWKALAKQGLSESLAGDTAPMKRAVAFCQVIEKQTGKKVHKVSSKQIAEMFEAVVEAYQETETDTTASKLRCEAEHVDGSMNATQKEKKIDWLKAPTPDNTCRILSNVRCLSEGVDVPALDAVLFLTPRNSQIDVVQSVGRVMRTTPGKTRGYIVLPVVIPSGVEPHVALNDNETYKVVWQVLQALRSHDDRFDAMINKLDLIGKDPTKMEVIAVSDRLAKPKRAQDAKKAAKTKAVGGQIIGAKKKGAKAADLQAELEFEVGDVERAIYAKLVEKVGNRHHWEDWAKDIASIARAHITRITAILDTPANTRERKAFDHFAAELRDDLNDSITRDEIIEMLAQHLVTKPVFDALFSGYSFASNNPISKAMQGVLDALQEHHLASEASTLTGFYESVKMRAEGIDNAQGKQKIVVELYDKFFRNAFPKMSERLGIVYTPVEIVDFILNSVDHLLRKEFGQTIGSEGVHVLDPFTGTGTFIVRLIQSGLISKDDLVRKYKSELHANELVLLAYYIAAINIEAAHHGVVGGDYRPFEGILLTDTFQLYEKEDLVSQVLVDNSARRKRQKKLDIRVIVGNPPYSVGQDSENDNNANVTYPLLDQRIRDTYVSQSRAKLAKGVYDSYVRAIRWASDRVGDRGIVGFVTNANFTEANTADGLRRCLLQEFSSLYVFHLRGNARTSGERRKKEAGNAFGGGSRAPVAISILVKNPEAASVGRIYFRDIGDYLTREEKLGVVAASRSVLDIAHAKGWREVIPDKHGDWLKQRDDSFGRHIAVGTKDKSDTSPRVFGTYSLGVTTNRDAWTIGPSHEDVGENMRRMIDFYNAELERFAAAHPTRDRKAREALVESFINTDSTKIAWTRALKTDFIRGTRVDFDPTRLTKTLYRPFTKQWQYFDRKLNEMVSQTPRLFPDAASPNLAIGVSASESMGVYTVLMTDSLPGLKTVDMVGSQFFPINVYEEDETETPLLPTSKKGRRDAITDAGLAHFQAAYPAETITKEDVFYYVYGILHSPDYRERFADNLGKELPRIPRVRTAADFWAFSKAGRELGELHVGYEKVTEFAATIEGPKNPTPAQYRVERMKFGKGKDKTVVHYNDLITVKGIPLDAYDYVVNGKPAIEWVMERQSVTTDKDSGIVKDANAWATETMGDPRYPLSLLLRVITVSLETNRIVASLPALDMLDEAQADTTPQSAPEIDDRPDAKVLPFRRVTPKPAERYKTCVPLVTLSAAAGAWSEEQTNIAEPSGPDVEWVAWDDSPRFTKGMFVARVEGRSMEPMIPDGAHCLFRPVDEPSGADRPVLVRHSGATDPETGGQFTVKRYRAEQSADGVTRVILEPANPAFQPLVLTPDDADDVRVVAEVVAVVS